jgi:hypothetical protein
MAGPAQRPSSCSSVQVAELRAEARRDLNAMLGPSGVAGLLIVAIGVWRGPGALWPVWGSVGMTIVVALTLGVWGTYLRGWRALRADRLRSAAGSPTRGRVDCHTDSV